MESVVFAAGDIANCDDNDTWLDEMKELVGLKESGREDATRIELLLELLGLKEEADGPTEAVITQHLLAAQEGTILALGDLAYPSGTSIQFAECYDRTWGRLKSRTRPVPGNHEYKSRNAGPYFDYWGSQAGARGKGYYSFDLPGWHVIALNSNIDSAAESDQYAWLEADLAASPAPCVLAYWHHPLYSSGRHGGRRAMSAVWRLLYREGATLVLSGHDHDYERVAPLDAEGLADAARGLRQFVVGTGGSRLRATKRKPLAQSESFTAEHLGVLRLELHEGSYSWSFLTANGHDFQDSGDAACNPRQAPS